MLNFFFLITILSQSVNKSIKYKKMNHKFKTKNSHSNVAINNMEYSKSKSLLRKILYFKQPI